MEQEFSKLAQSSMRWTIHPQEEKLKDIAKREGLWNLFIPVSIYLLNKSGYFFNFIIINIH